MTHPSDSATGPADVLVLGPLEVRAGGRRIEIGGPRRRAALALLVADTGRVVSMAALVDGLWGEQPPADAARTMRTYISRLRARLHELRPAPGEDVILTRPPGYLLRLAPDATDVARFERLAGAGRQAAADGQPALAARQLADALRLWRGTPYGEFGDIPALRAESARLGRLRLAVVEDRIDADQASGLGGELVAELESLVAQHPVHERLWGQLMIALYRAGRQADALGAFQRARRVLVEEAGQEPSPAVVRLHQRVLAQDPELLAAGVDEGPIAVGVPWTAPNQLPAAPRHFTGRQPQLTRLLAPAADASTPVVCAVDGMAGVGKTGLVVLAAHQLTQQGRYPDGSLFVDLHGYSGRAPLDPARALERLLSGLGVPGPQIPADLDARAALYRTITARRRLLIVLDNALDEAQVRPLLPGTPGCLVLVTSRRRLAGLDEADHLTLDTLTAHEAARLFRAAAGPDRDPGDQDTIEQLVAACGLVPLAVRIAAARLRTSRTWTGATLLGLLRAAQDRLVELDDGERSVRAAFTVSFQQLPADQRQAFAALGLHPGTDYEPHATAALLDTTVAHAARLLGGLEQVNLLEEPTGGRYRFHDLIRAYADTAHPPVQADRLAALGRLHDHYVGAASAAAGLAYPCDADRLPPLPPRPAATNATEATEATEAAPTTAAPVLPDRAAALGWLDTELANLVAAHETGGEHPEHVTHLAATLNRHLRARGHYSDAHALHLRALAAADATGDHAAQLTALSNLGWVHCVQGRYDAAAECHTRALRAARAAGDRSGEADALNGLGQVHYARGRPAEAAEHHGQALTAARAGGHRAAELDALTGLGRIHHSQGRYDQASECYTEALRVARDTGNRDGELTPLIGLGWIEYLRGRYDEAADRYLSALATIGDTGNRGGELTARYLLGHVHRARGSYGAATTCYLQALDTARATGHRGGELDALTGLGHVHHAQGRQQPAADRFTEVLELAREIGNRNWQYEGHLGYGRTRQALGQPKHAITAYRQAMAIARELDQPRDQARAHDGLAHAQHALGRFELARADWQAALDILTELDIPAAEDVTVDGIRGRLAALGALQCTR